MSLGVQFAAMLAVGAFMVSPKTALAQRDIAFVDVSVLPMGKQEILVHQTVLVRRGMIHTIGRVDSMQLARGTRRIDGRGRFLVPGLADMHTHDDDPADVPLFLANGVTTTLHMGGSSAWYRHTLRAKIAAGQAIAPYPLSALLLDGPGDAGGVGVVPASAAEARRVVAQARFNGYDYIKIYSRVQPDIFDAVMSEAARVGITVIGHVVRSVGLARSLTSGERMLAHGEEYLTVFDDDDHPDSTKIPELVRLTTATRAWVTPNLMGIQRIAEQWGKGDPVVEGWLASADAHLMRPALREKWRSKGFTRLSGTYDAQAGFVRQLVPALYRAGVPLLAGTDTPDIVGSEPGFALHDEIELLARAGLTTFDALATATRNCGQFVAGTVPGAEAFGQVAVGYRADLLLVEVNPLEHLETLRQPLGVMVRGTWLPAAKLLSWLNQPRRAYDAAERDNTAFLRVVDSIGVKAAVVRFRAVLARERPLKIPELQLLRASRQHFRQGRFEIAESLYRLTITLYPRSWASYQGLGAVLEKVGRTREAAASSRRALALNPKITDH